jgi:hypothetical protein
MSRGAPPGNGNAVHSDGAPKLRILYTPPYVNQSGPKRKRVFTCLTCGYDVKRDEPAQNGSVAFTCRCGLLSIPIGNAKPENPTEWAYVVQRLKKRLKRSGSQLQIGRILTHDYVREFRLKFGAILEAEKSPRMANQGRQDTRGHSKSSTANY